MITSRDTTEARIMEASLRLFARKGFGAVGIREIATEAGVSTAALYHYMKSKEDLLLTLMSDRLHRIHRSVTLAWEGLERPEERLAAMTLVHVISHALHQDWVVDDQVHYLRDALRDSVIELRDRYEKLWADVIAEGTSSVFHVEDPGLARLALLEMCNGVAAWFSAKGPLTPAQIAERFVDMAFGLLSAERRGLPIRLADLQLPPSSHYQAIVQKVYEAEEA